MKSFYSFLIITAILLGSCDNEITQDSFDFDIESEFKIAQEYHSVEGKLRFSISEVNDSRCPQDVICVWAGKADVKIKINQPGQISIQINTYDNQIDSIMGYSFELKEVTPYPLSTKKTEQKDYRIFLLIRKISN